MSPTLLIWRRSQILGLLLLAVAACSPGGEQGSLLVATQPAVDHALVVNELVSLHELMAQTTTRNGEFGKTDEPYLTPCMRLRFTTAFSPDTLLLDFDTAGCVSTDGVVRRGRVRYVARGGFRAPGHFGNVFLEDYSVNGMPMTAVNLRVTLRPGPGPAGYTHRWEVDDIRLRTPEGTISWKGGYEVVQTEGIGSSNPFAPRYSVAGSAAGFARDSRRFDSETLPERPLRRHTSCRNFLAGVERTSISGGGIVTLDYDDLGLYRNDPNNPDACDAQVVCVQSGNTIRRSLR